MALSTVKEVVHKISGLHNEPVNQFKLYDLYLKAIEENLKLFDTEVFKLVKELPSTNVDGFSHYLYKNKWLIELYREDSYIELEEFLPTHCETFGLYVKGCGVDLNIGDTETPYYIDLEEFLRWQYSNGSYTLEDHFEYVKFNNSYYWLPVYVNNHSGISFSTSAFSCGWDSGLAGIIYISKKEFSESGVYEVKKRQAASIRKDWAQGWLYEQICQLDSLEQYGQIGVTMYDVSNVDQQELNSQNFNIRSQDCEEVYKVGGFVGDHAEATAIYCAIEEVA